MKENNIENMFVGFGALVCLATAIFVADYTIDLRDQLKDAQFEITRLKWVEAEMVNTRRLYKKKLKEVEELLIFLPEAGQE